MTVTTSSAPRTYGGWRERRGFGIAGMDGRATAVAIGVGVLALGIGMFTTAGLLMMAPVLLAVAGATVLRWRGEPVLVLVRRHAAFRRARRKGWATLAAGIGAARGGAVDPARTAGPHPADRRPG